MAGELVSAYIRLVPTVEGIQGATARAFAPAVAEADRAGEKAGTRFGSVFGTASKRLLIAGSGLLGGVIGAGIAKGFTRLNAIDEARAKLLGLGNSAKVVDKVMANSLTAVKGTAFGLDEAATGAATAVAAGIEPGKQLAKYLALVADTATITNTSFSDTARVLNQARTVGAAYNDTLQTLAQRGLPVYSLLAQALSKTPADIKKLASEGKISADVLEKALTQKIGGSAQKSGKTFTGSLKNMGAALGRLGASAESGVFERLPKGFSTITSLLDGLGPTAKRFGDSVGRGIDAVVRKVETLQDKLGGIDFSKLDGKKLATALISGIGGAIDGLGSLAAKFTTKLGQVFGKIDWVGIGITVGKQAPAFLLGLAAGILNFDFGSLISGIGKHWSDILIGVLIVAFAPSKLIGPIGKVLGKIPFVGKFIEGAIKGLNTFGGKIKTALATAFREGFAGVRIPGAGIITRIIGAFKALPKRLGSFFKTISTGVGSFGIDVARAFGRGFGHVINFLTAPLRAIEPFIMKSLSRAGSWLVQIGKDVIGGLGRGIESAFSFIRGKLAGVAQIIPAWLKKLLGIASPSKVMIPIGQNIGAGIAVGIANSSRHVERATTGLVASATPKSSSISALSRSASVAPAAAGKRPIYMDGTLFGWMHEIANGAAEIVVAKERDFAGTAGRMS